MILSPNRAARHSLSVFLPESNLGKERRSRAEAQGLGRERATDYLGKRP